MYVFCIHKDVLYYCSNSIDASLLLFNDVETTYTLPILLLFSLFFFNDTATTEIYTLSLHDALPISRRSSSPESSAVGSGAARGLIADRVAVTVTAPRCSALGRSTRASGGPGTAAVATIGAYPRRRTPRVYRPVGSSATRNVPSAFVTSVRPSSATLTVAAVRGWPAVSTTVPRSVSPPASNDVRSAAMVRVTTCLPGNNERLAAYPTEGHVASRPENTWGRPNECGRARLCANYALNPCRTGGRA